MLHGEQGRRDTRRRTDKRAQSEQPGVLVLYMCTCILVYLDLGIQRGTFCR
jgi:hypothetical protein